MKRFALPFILLFAIPAWSDSITLSVVAQQCCGVNGQGFVVSLDPSGNPLLHETFSQGGRLDLDFSVSSTSPSPTALVANLTIGGQALPERNLTIPAAGSSITWGWSLPFVNKPVPGTLKLDWNGQSESFNFMFLQEVPEPTTLLFLGTGLVGIGWLKYRVRQAA